MIDLKHFHPHFNKLNATLNHLKNTEKHRPALKAMIEQFKLNFPEHTGVHLSFDLIYKKRRLSH